MKSGIKKLGTVLLFAFFLACLCGFNTSAASSTSVKRLSVGKTYTVENYQKVKSANTKVASVKKLKDKSYKVTAKKKGRVTMKCYNKKGKVVKKIYLLVANSEDFKFDTSKITLVKGKTKKAAAEVPKGCTVKYSSKNSDVAMVNSKGKITAQKTGSTTISAKIYYKDKLIKTKTKKVAVKLNTGSSGSSSSNIKILFIGNSRTYKHDIPTKFSKLAKSLGKNVSVTSIAVQNATLRSLSKTKKSKIISKSYDYVILQENSDVCVDYDNFYKGAKAITDMVKKVNPSVKIILRKMWKQASDSTSMKKLAYDNTNKVAKKINAVLSFDGSAFEKCNKRYPSLETLSDNCHQTLTGAYLSACCIYIAVFKESPVGATYYSTLDKKTAQRMQQIAEDVS